MSYWDTSATRAGMPQIPQLSWHVLLGSKDQILHGRGESLCMTIPVLEILVFVKQSSW